MLTILIVEDESSIAQSLQFVLETEGFNCHGCGLAEEGVNYALNQSVDLIILDIGLPDISGIEACKRIRQYSDVPIIFLTARGEEIDRVVGLEIGADDYVVKPFSPREVCARVKAILKRTQTSTENKPYRSGTTISETAKTVQAYTHQSPFSVDVGRCQIRFNSQALPLTKTEFQIFQHLLKHPGHVFSRSQLLEAMENVNHENYERSVDTHIKTLRAKLRAANANHEAIATVRGFGYSYDNKA